MPFRPALPAVLVTVAALLAGCGGGTPTPGAAGAPDRPSQAVEPARPSASTPGGPDISVPANLDDVIASVNARSRTAVPDGPDRRVVGADASWPQCPKGMGIPQKRSKGSPMPTDDAEFVVLGLTNGPSFTPNPCLADQVGWARSHGLLASAYAVVSWPSASTLAQVRDDGPFDGRTRLGALHNAGYAAAAYSVRVMRAAGLDSPAVWVDVEPVPDFDWSSSTADNAAVVEGTVRGYRDAGLAVGYYSVRSLWTRVLGAHTTGGAPEWRAAGETSMATALARCAPSWSYAGGPGVLAQWVEDGRDRNVTCPGQGGHLGRWFTRLEP
ncbi:hypothetical protein [Nocardioides jiangxiensis]|uniref:Lyzozyme M1 (1,4-beta-N-acetylmuramidase), GH25 family n=1 Tax=Nocardioides jiangxiensis TaxID=3064524 RepID=A0ABT9AZT7_9ACTN|nr:hypothetical protein [Nocardioides sp. WY-20]MDO7867967.1 hypothetical protein [Nocardioides sp. WY-20]